jgi:hypothetical protein
MRSREKVQEAIVERLETKSGLDLKTIDVTATAVSFEKNLAYATVAFHPKGDPSVNSGMVMKYTLEERDGKWAVVKVGDSQGHSLSKQSPADQLPPGHPALDQMPSSVSLLPGHPAVDPKRDETGSEKTSRQAQ